jgi:hypothetical protein
MAWKLSNLPGGEDANADYVEQATAAPNEKRDLGGWRFKGTRSAGPCPNCGSENTYVEMLDASIDMDLIQIPGMKYCLDCSGPDGE